MIVKELIEKLKEIDENLEVFVELEQECYFESLEKVTVIEDDFFLSNDYF